MYVLPEFRGTGIGTQLIVGVLAEAAARDCLAINLEVDSDHQLAEVLDRCNDFCELARSR